MSPKAEIPALPPVEEGPKPQPSWRPEGGRIAPDMRARGARASTLRSLTIGYTFGLGGLALVLAIIAWNVTSILDKQVEMASLVGQAGFQRTLAERIVHAAEMAEHRALGLGDVGAMGATLEVFAATHARLADSVRRDGAIEMSALRRRYFGEYGLNAQVETFKAHAHALSAALRARREAEIATSAQALRDGFPSLQASLFAAVGEHQALIKTAGIRARNWQIAGAGAGLAFLLFLALAVFRPLSRRAADVAGRLSDEARTDPLTGLLNRRAILSVVEAAMGRGDSIAVVSVDLDHFKETNDAEGHEAGDAVLQAAAARLKRAVRPEDTVGRLGGDEFIAVLIGVESEDEAAAAAGRIRAAIAQPVSYKGQGLRLGATVGVAMAPIHANTPDAVIRAADSALLRAKRSGRGSIGCANSEDATRAARGIAVARALQPARHDFLEGVSAHFQPIMSMTDGEVRGAEALARWHHPELGPIPPDEFLPAAQRLGLLHLVSGQVRTDALRQYAALRRVGLAPARLTLNLSAAELLRDGVVAGLEEEVGRADLDISSLSFEITEDAVLERVAHTTLDRLAALRGRGARIALDDFGTGTSGLAQMLRVPLDAIKLDRSFTKGLGTDGRAERIVEGAVRLAHSMGLVVVAEGIETDAQARLLRDLGCDFGQGYLWGRPMSADDFRAWLLNRQAGPRRVVALRS